MGSDGEGTDSGNWGGDGEVNTGGDAIPSRGGGGNIGGDPIEPPGPAGNAGGGITFGQAPARHLPICRQPKPREEGFPAFLAFQIVDP